MSDIKVSIIVCTYNRFEILKDCLDSLINQSVDGSPYEVIVVDNNSTDKTKEVVQKYCKENSNIKYVFEENQGLSHARNRGAKEAKSEWIGYVDDDAFVDEKFFENVFNIIDDKKFEIFGGVYLPWYKTPKPKWYKDVYGSNMNKAHDKNVLSEMDFVDGGVMFIKRSIFKELAEFSKDLGMKGSAIGYGEETELQIRAREAGKIIGFYPQIKIYHLVPESKMKLSWFLMSSYRCGLQSRIIFSKKNDNEFKGFSLEIISEILRSIKKLIKNWKKLLDKEYYWQNYIIDNLSISMYSLGRINSFRNKEF